VFADIDQRAPFGLSSLDYDLCRELDREDATREQHIHQLGTRLITARLMTSTRDTTTTDSSSGASIRYDDLVFPSLGDPLTHEYLERYRRQADEEAGERSCQMGDRCMCMLLTKFHPNGVAEAHSSASFVGREFLLPEQEQAWVARRQLPSAEPAKCLLCEMFYTTMRVYRYLRVYQIEPFEVLQKFRVEVNRTDGRPGYTLAQCLPLVHANGRRSGIVAPFPRFDGDHYVFDKKTVRRRHPSSTAERPVFKTVTLRCYREINVNFC
jgi:hypothetical protein